jgi:membrane-associated phospholipid phosphatase
VGRITQQGIDSGADHRRIRETWPIHWPDLGLLLACYAAMVAAWSAVGFVVVDLLDDTAIGRADVRIANWLADRRTPSRDDISHIGSLLSETGTKIVLTAIVGLVLLYVFKRWLEPLIIAVSLILEAMVFITTSVIVGRSRPDVVRLDGSPVGTSYPSGHVAAAACYAAMALVVFWHTRRWWPRALAVVLTVAVTFAVALARMYRGMHFLTDVVAGALLGIASVIVVTRILCRAEERRDEPTRAGISDDQWSNEDPHGHLSPTGATP